MLNLAHKYNLFETIQFGAKAGQFFEIWAVSEIVKSFLNAGKSLRDLYYYRDADQREIDLILKIGRVLYPIEIKMTAKPKKYDPGIPSAGTGN